MDNETPNIFSSASRICGKVIDALWTPTTRELKINQGEAACTMAFFMYSKVEYLGIKGDEFHIADYRWPRVHSGFQLYQIDKFPTSQGSIRTGGMKFDVLGVNDQEISLREHYRMSCLESLASHLTKPQT